MSNKDRNLTREVMEDLSRPFPASMVNWKPQATYKDKSRALAVAYVDMRAYQDRLNEIVGPDWSDDYEVQGNGALVICRLTICGVTRSDVGEADPSGQNTATSAIAQAFKRACVKFGLGAYLYKLPKEWEDYDAQKKSFTKEALARLQAMVSNFGQSNGSSADYLAIILPPGKYAQAGKSLGWLKENDPAFLAEVAQKANDDFIKAAAKQVLAA